MRLPTSWNNITVGKFQELHPVITSDGKLIDRVPALIAVLSGVPLDDIKKIKLSEYKKIANNLEFLNTFNTLNKIPETVKIDGHRYHIDTNINNMNAAQYMDFTTLLKKCDGDEYKIIQNMHEILSCVIIKDIRKPWGWKRGEYEGEDFEANTKAIKDHLSIKYAYPIAVFFWTLLEQLTPVMQDYGKAQMVKADEILRGVEKDLQNNGVGM